MAVLHRQEIKDRINRRDYDNRLLITPLLSVDQIGPGSVDIRLGSTIIVPRKTYVASQDVTEKKRIRQLEGRLYERIRLKYHTSFVLHPRQIILGGTLEYLSLPYDTCASVASRSSWGRLGLVVATASVIQPGFKGALTLELCNLSESPITLYPGLLVGQLVFYDVPSKAEKASYTGRYDCPTEAGLPLFHGGTSDKEMVFWREKPSDAGPD
ncbi:MAG: dCTP deaminase [Planctomycetota bacterium]|jgi:dCTP deaminase